MLAWSEDLPVATDELDEQIELARRHVEAARAIVERQRDLNVMSEQMLANFERSLRVFEDDLTRLLRQKAARN